MVVSGGAGLGSRHACDSQGPSVQEQAPGLNNLFLKITPTLKKSTFATTKYSQKNLS